MNIMNCETNYAYEERYVAYFDLLGWEGAIKENPDNPSKKVLEAINIIKKTAILSYKSIFEYAIISDGIIISCPSKNESLINNMGSIGNVCRELLAKGFLCRGGLTRGKCFHKGNIIFGPAINRVVTLEKEAKNPVILCDNKLNSIIEKNIYEYPYTSNIGPLFVSNLSMKSLIDEMNCKYILNLFPSSINRQEKKWNHDNKIQDIIEIRKKIENNINQFSNDEEIIKKWKFAKALVECQLSKKLHDIFWKNEEIHYNRKELENFHQRFQKMQKSECLSPSYD